MVMDSLSAVLLFRIVSLKSVSVTIEQKQLNSDTAYYVVQGDSFRETFI